MQQFFGLRQILVLNNLRQICLEHSVFLYNTKLKNVIILRLIKAYYSALEMIITITLNFVVLPVSYGVTHFIRLFYFLRGETQQKHSFNLQTA